MRRMCSLLVSAMLGILAAGTPLGAQEFRGLYVDAFHPGIKTHEEVTTMVREAKAANFNALIVQVRKRGDAYYRSNVEPRAADIAADYDPLADVITQAHAAGLEVHAWLSVCEVSHELYTPVATHVCRLHPDWLMTTRDGSTVLADGKIHVDPGVPAVRANFISVVTDLLKNYDVDGIHLDNIRYPNKKSGYNPTSVARFNEQFNRSGIPADEDEAWCQWRRDQLTQFVREVQSTVASIKPKAKLSASVILQPRTASNLFLQQYDTWTKENLVDFLVTMLYMTVDRMPEIAGSVLSVAYERHVYIGVGAYRISPELATKHIQDVRAVGGSGVVLFSYHYVGPNSAETICTKMSNLVSVFEQAADLPQMPWKQ